MTVAYRSVIKAWLGSIVKAQSDTPVQVFESNAPNKIAATLVECAEQYSLKIFCFRFALSAVDDPLRVLRTICLDFQSEMGEQAFNDLLSQYCYPSHLPSIQAWLAGQYHYREEPMLFDEAGYERFEFHNSIRNILSALAQQQPFLLVLDNIQYAPDAILTALNSLLVGSGLAKDWGVCGLLPTYQVLSMNEHRLLWNQSLTLLERTGLILPVVLKRNDIKQTIEWQEPDRYSGFSSFFQLMVAASDLFCHQDVMRMIESSIGQFRGIQAGQLLFVSGYCALMLDQLDVAIAEFNSALNKLQTTNNDNIIIATHYWLSICYTIKGQEQYARSAQEQTEKLAIDTNDSRWFVLSQFSAFYIDARLAQHRLTASGLRAQKFALVKCGYVNLLGSILSQVFSAHQSNVYDSPSVLLNNCVQALRLARQQRNVLAASTALQGMGICHARLGNNAQTTRLFVKSLELRKGIQRKSDLIPMLNGLGYHMTGIENWQEAWRYFEEAIGLLLEHRNFTELTVTLFNVAWLYSQTGHFHRAIECLNDLLELMSIRGINTLPFRNIKDIYALKGWLHTQLNQPVQARYCISRIDELSSLHTTSFCKVMQLLLYSRVLLLEGNTLSAQSTIQKSQVELNNSDGFDLYLHSLFELELARLLYDIGETQAAQQLFNDLRDKAAEQRLSVMALRVSKAAMGLKSIEKTPLPKMLHPYRLVIDIFNKEALINELQQQLTDLQQSQFLVNMSEKEADNQIFVQQLIEVIDRRVPANSVVVYVSGIYDNQLQPLLLSNDVSTDELLHWTNLLDLEMGKHIQLVLDDQGQVLEAWNLGMKTVSQAWLILVGDEDQSKVWNRSYVTLLASQLGLVLDRRFREDILAYQSRTDLLTGTLNRAGLFERMARVFKEMQRNPDRPLTLCYFDLDHFKYFNDHFGHELGDAVLRKLAQLVSNSIRPTDELGRIGGDEFILLINNLAQSEAGVLLERIRAAIAAPSWWLALLDRDEHDNPVPKQHWISASFGAVTVTHWPIEHPIDRTQLLAQADKAMYEAKKQGKNRIHLVAYQDTVPPNQDD